MKRYNFPKKTRVNKLGVTTQLVYGLWLGLRLKNSNNWTILNAQHTQSHIISQRHLCTNTELQDGTNWSILYGWKQPTFLSDTTCFCIHMFASWIYMYIVYTLVTYWKCFRLLAFVACKPLDIHWKKYHEKQEAPFGGMSFRN